MENKYSFDKLDNGLRFDYIVEEAIPKYQKSDCSDIGKVAYIKGGFSSESDAKEYIAWKNQNGIDKEIKQQIIEVLECTVEQDKRYCRAMGDGIKDKDIHYDLQRKNKEAIEIIKSLSESE